ncbi:MAG: 2-oxoacid:acceptor oxidoreductase subunit alpha [Sulfuricurvum sp.]|nr:2-oxoacid:acceptor oxidoreductase subunit alpha [Sulfuricurvum sp.]
MTLNELKRYNGRNGMSAYVAYKGTVYDVTQSPFWKEGNHQGQHNAGADLTIMMAGAPHGDEVFAKMPVVATLEEEPLLQQSDASAATPLKERLQIWYKKYHPHPMTVHFPIALHMFSAGLDLFFLASPKVPYAVGVFYTFFVATVMGFVAMIAGVLSWWINYNLSTRRPFVVKLIVATLTLLLGVVGIALYLENPGIVYEASLEGITYHAIILFTGMSVIVLGYYGGKITWGDLSQYDTKTVVSETEEPLSAAAGKLPAAGTYEVPFSSAATMAPVKEVRYEVKEGGIGRPNTISILIGGAAGAGIDTLENLLCDAFKRSGYYLFSTKEYMSRVRGGSNTVLIRISDTPLEAPCWEVDLFIAMDALALEHAKERCTSKTIIVADQTFAQMETNSRAIPMKETAQKLGNVHYANTYVAGVAFGLLGIEPQPLIQSVAEHFKEDTANAAAVNEGCQAGGKLERSTLPALPKADRERSEKLHLMDGTTASGFGFLSGGCNFVASYPMSPSTGVLNFMASMSKQFTIAVEQSEDEIASLHMVLGAWYAGARALTTTSGGGFALMGEALSLSGMTETPAVIYLAQRPGPATGLPTRSEQGDLNLALHSGHGPFPRLILAPGSLRECIDLGYLAFELADRYQLPVIILSDQYLADSIAMIGDVDFSAYEQRRYIVRTDKEYRRYADTQEGISPRGVPGFGEGLVCADGHEHDERGQITEDYRKRIQMASKRARKETGLIAQAVAPYTYGEGSIAVIGWGSTRGAIAEALQQLDDPRLVQIHFAWVHPLNPEHLLFLKKYTHVIVVENNADGAFADRLQHYGIVVESRVLQYNGFSFFADQLSAMISERIKELS